MNRKFGEKKTEFESQIYKTELGKRTFKDIFEISELNKNDTFLLILTKNDKCIHYGVKYLKDFVKLYHRRRIYILLDNVLFKDSFSKAGGIVKVCDPDQMQNLACYFNLFHMKRGFDTRIIFLTEKDKYGISVNELLEKKEFSLEEYVAISLYHLKKLKEGD